MNVFCALLFVGDPTSSPPAPAAAASPMESAYFQPGQITVRGSFRYVDRNNADRPARFVRVLLYDDDANSDDDLLGQTTTDQDGVFQFAALPNQDNDEPGSTLDIYVIWVAEFNDSAATQRRVADLNGASHRWQSETRRNVPNGVVAFNGYRPTANLPAMWIFQDLRRSWEYVRNSVNIDPGSVTARWENNVDCWLICASYFYGGVGGPYIFISRRHQISSDVVVHEAAHHYLYNRANWWVLDAGCFNHEIFLEVNSETCAWSEGWADFLPLPVNNDACFDWREGPCSGIPDQHHYNLETHSRNDNPAAFPWGDRVEGRIAGALYDLFDNDNEGFDSAAFGFGPIAAIVLDNQPEDRFFTFWQRWRVAYENRRHHALRALHQNTIDYNTPPRFDPLLPDRVALRGVAWPRALDLWSYAVDDDSPDSELSFQIMAVSDNRCGVTLTENRWINLAPQANRLGVCDVTVRASDTIAIVDNVFRVMVAPILAHTYMPAIIKPNVTASGSH
ncbi:MAG: transthyretin-like family protein [Caldilinea sp.]|nr:transthyretin-like family protein [Caldilinea sp.]MDW8440987.1 hypothetical protein [Caldilineaceae bacterium]